MKGRESPKETVPAGPPGRSGRSSEGRCGLTRGRKAAGARRRRSGSRAPGHSAGPAPLLCARPTPCPPGPSSAAALTASFRACAAHLRGPPKGRGGDERLKNKTRLGMSLEPNSSHLTWVSCEFPDSAGKLQPPSISLHPKE